MAPWPELLEKQKRNYAQQGLDWKRVARTRIFPQLPERWPRIRRLHRELRRSIPGSWAKARRALDFDLPVRFVLYVGVGCGAGWATQYEGQAACLLGLENAVELPTLRGGSTVVPHEVAHIAHDHWRRRRGLGGIDAGRGPYWQLYVEGFATAVERRIAGPGAFRRRTGRSDWLAWCEDHRSWLAKKFLSDLRRHRSMRPFFGSWYDIRGYRESGYWLGAEVVATLEATRSWRQLATLPERTVRNLMRSGVEELALPDARRSSRAGRVGPPSTSG